MDLHALEEAIQQVWGEWLTADFELRYAARSAAAQELLALSTLASYLSARAAPTSGNAEER